MSGSTMPTHSWGSVQSFTESSLSEIQAPANEQQFRRSSRRTAHLNVREHFHRGVPRTDVWFCEKCRITFHPEGRVECRTLQAPRGGR